MDFLISFIAVFLHYWYELWWTLAIGFFLSGVIYFYIPTPTVERYLGKKGLKPIVIASLVGAILPVCCIGSLPIALTLKRKGASLGAVLAFLIATPATSVSALIVCWKLMGLTFTAVIFLSVIFMGLLIGILANVLNFQFEAVEGKTDYRPKEPSCCREDDSSEKGRGPFLKKVLGYAFIQLPRDMGLEITIGIVIASIITVFEPLQTLIHQYLVGGIGYVFVLMVGLMTYVCSTASVPLAHALLVSGMSSGQALCYLLVGPITSYSTIMVIRKDFGTKILSLYLGLISVCALTVGILMDVFF